MQKASLPQDRNGFQQIANDFLHIPAFDLGLGADDEAMAQHAQRDGLNVLVGEVVPAVEQGPRPGAAQQAQRSPRTGPQGEVGMLAAGLGQIDDVLQERVLAVDLATCPACRGSARA